MLSLTPALLSSAANGDQGRQYRGKAVVASVPLSNKRYQGVVKWFRGTYGWVDCAEVSKQYAGHDIFVHINDCNFQPKQGDEVAFNLSLDDRGNPKAVKAHAPIIINARDYFNQREART